MDNTLALSRTSSCLSTSILTTHRFTIARVIFAMRSDSVFASRILATSQSSPNVQQGRQPNCGTVCQSKKSFVTQLYIAPVTFGGVQEDARRPFIHGRNIQAGRILENCEERFFSAAPDVLKHFQTIKIRPTKVIEAGALPRCNAKRLPAGEADHARISGGHKN